MRDERIGNDIRVAWTLLLGEDQAFNLEGLNVSLYLKSVFGRKPLNDFTITGNVITWTFFGKDQKASGKYSLELVVNNGEEGMITTDACDFVNLVPCTCKIVNNDDEDGVEIETIEIKSMIDAQSVYSIVDSELSETSEHPVQNKVITAALKEKQDVVADLDAIRSGAAKGATAIQEVKTINGESIVGSGNINIQGGSGDSPIDYGEAEHSAVLKGETTALGETYKNEALNEGCVSLGANSKAGLKGYYFTYIDFDTNQIWLHNKQFTSRALGSLGGWKKNSVSDSNRCGWSVDDIISFTCDGHYDNCATIRDVTDNVITVDKIPFTLDDVPSTIVNIGVANNKFDECSVFCVKKYNIGTVELGGGAFAIGTNTKAVNAVAYAEGYNTTAYGKYSHAEGNETEAGYNAHSEGYLTKAIGHRSHAEGRENIAEGNCSHAEGRDNQAIGENAHAEGWYTQALGKQSHAEGYSTIAKENQSHAEGKETQALGNASHAEGLQTIASGPSSHAEGEANVAGGDCSHVEGYLNETNETGAHIEGRLNRANAIYSHVEGVNNNAEGDFSHTEGVGRCYIIGIRSGKNENKLYELPSLDDKALLSVGDKVYRNGYSSVSIKTIYSGDSKWIELSDKIGHIRPYDEDGNLTFEKVLFVPMKGDQLNRTGGASSHAEGVGTQTSNYGESSVGRFNESKDGLIFSVGNGTSDEERQNAFEVYEDGRVYFGLLEDLANAIEDKLSREEFEERIEGYATHDSVQELSDNVTELSTEVSGLSERVETLEQGGQGGADEILRVEYGVTTFQEIYDAYYEGKYIVFEYANNVFHINRVTATDIYFVSINGTIGYRVGVGTQNNWYQGVYQNEQSTNKVTSLSDKSTDSQYPSAKAVYDFVNNTLGTLINGEY